MFELKLGLHQSKHIPVTFHLATDPTFPDLDLIFLPFYFDFSCWVFKFDAIVVSLDGDV